MRPRFVILEGEPGGIASDEYEALIAGGSREPRHPQIDENAIAELFYTSGTTGLPKGVALTQRKLYLHAVHAEVALGWQRGRRRPPRRPALPRQRLGRPPLR